MKKYINPSRKEWIKLTERPAVEQKELFKLVHQLFAEIKKDGDKALVKYSRIFDKTEFDSRAVSNGAILKAETLVSAELKSAIQLAKANIERFHQSQIERINPVETSRGVICWRECRPIERIGIYIPGGEAPLFSTVLMLGVPAAIAGCKEIILCTPPDKKGDVNPAILYAAQLVGISKIFAIGGIQAIGGMTFGTATIPKVDKLFGPGNQYVTAAKQIAQHYGVAIDMPAGPSEVLVIADASSKPEFVASDLLSQAEHGSDSQVILLSDSEEVVDLSLLEIKNQVKKLPRKEIAEMALKNSKALVFKNLLECLDFSNIYAPEHLILAIQNFKEVIPQIQHAGSVFLGNYSCESAGDYASGTNHTLPTNGYARSYSGVSLDSFVKKITFQEISPAGIKNIGPAIEIMAEAEQLLAHKNAVRVRLNSL
jgi:histidinol dehydrogenase